MKHFQNHIAVWMDYHMAHFISANEKGEYSIKHIESPHDIHPREDGQTSDDAIFGKFRGSNNEYKKHNIERNELREYYESLQNELVKYDEILLFGPTKAKQEFFNLLLENKAFNGKRIAVENADKMTEPQLFDFVKEYFTPGVKK